MSTRRIETKKGHSYVLDGEPVTGVTTIINQGLPKPALVAWAGNTVAGYAADHWDELAELPISKRIEQMKKAPYADRDAAANKGTQVHGLAEQLGRGEQVEVPDSLAGHVESCVKFLDDWDVQMVLQEVPVFSRKHRYAGTLDFIAKLADGRTVLGDYKTNRSGPFGEVALQLAAYRYAEFYLDHEGNEQPMPPVDGCVVVWVRADGYDLYDFTADEQVHRSFLYVQQVANFSQISRGLKSDALTPPGKDN